jgi:hypothetical protein
VLLFRSWHRPAGFSGSLASLRRWPRSSLHWATPSCQYVCRTLFALAFDVDILFSEQGKCFFIVIVISASCGPFKRANTSNNILVIIFDRLLHFRIKCAGVLIQTDAGCTYRLNLAIVGVTTSRTTRTWRRRSSRPSHEPSSPFRITVGSLTTTAGPVCIDHRLGAGKRGELKQATNSRGSRHPRAPNAFLPVRL